MRRTLLSIAALSVLLGLLDRLYRVLHPDVNLERACLVGATALAVLAPLWLLRRPPLDPFTGALAIFASAFGSVLLIEAGVLLSQSPTSAVVHVGILAAVFTITSRERGAREARRSLSPRPDR